MAGLRLVRTFALLVVGVVVVGLPPPGGGPRANVLLISVDTLRARNLGLYGYERDTSPNIDRLGRGGAVFLRAYAESSWTIPSLASLLTGLAAPQHHTLQPRSTLARDLPYLPALLRRAGYATATFVQSAYPLLKMGFARGFGRAETLANYKTDAALAWIRTHRDRPFFLWMHYSEPHTPYTPSPRFERLFTTETLKENGDAARYWDFGTCRARYERDPDATDVRLAFYDARVREADEHVGKFLSELERLGLDASTLVILTADHGEEFFEHRGCDHGQTFYDEVLHVPLVLRRPGVVPAGRRIETQVRLVDVMPTVLDALGLAAPPGVAGRSLLPLLEDDGPDRPVIGGFLANTERAVFIRHRDFKYVYSPYGSALRQAATGAREELYDLVADPAERRNLAAPGHPRLARFRRKAERWVAARRRRSAPRAHFDAATTARLRALGYLQDVEPAAQPE